MGKVRRRLTTPLAMPPILLLVPVLELLGLLGFIYLAPISTVPRLRYLPVVVAVIAVVLLFAREAGSMTMRQLAVAAAMSSVLAVVAFQIVGFIYPGLAKDVDALSFENVARLAVTLAIAFVVHGCVLTLCHFSRGRLRGCLQVQVVSLRRVLSRLLLNREL